MTLYRHKKRGSLYRIMLQGKLQCSGEMDNALCVVYQGITDGQTWIRPESEFYDGSFEEVLEDKFW